MKLTDAFESKVIQLKPIATTKDGQKALFVPFIDARHIMNRLDQVLGEDKWRDEYTVITSQGEGEEKWVVLCTLYLHTAEWIGKGDVGVGSTAKEAFTDAFKRAAVKWGVARYLYFTTKVWAPIKNGAPENPDEIIRKLFTSQAEPASSQLDVDDEPPPPAVTRSWVGKIPDNPNMRANFAKASCARVYSYFSRVHEINDREAVDNIVKWLLQEVGASQSEIPDTLSEILLNPTLRRLLNIAIWKEDKQILFNTGGES